MTDAQVVVLWLLTSTVAGGIGGGIIAGLIIWGRTRWPRAILTGIGGRYELPVDVQLRAQPVALAVKTTQPDPITVEIVTAGGPTQRELAARTIATFPTIGPTDLSNIVQCSKSTAHAIIRDAREGRLILPDVPEPTEEE